MACNRRLPPSPLGRKSSLPQTLCREENRPSVLATEMDCHKENALNVVTEGKSTEAKIENPEKRCGNDDGAKKKTIRRPRSKRPYFLRTKACQEKLKVLRAAAACVYINKQHPEKASWEEDAGTSENVEVKDFEAECDNIGVHLLAEVATELSLAGEEKEERRIRKKKTTYDYQKNV